jgi:hypothetical protein
MEFEKIMPNTVHGLCTWHIGQNAIKILVGKKKRNCNEVVNGKEILEVFKVCMYNYEDETEFEKPLH